MVLDAIARHLQHTGHTITRIYTMFDNASPLSPALNALPRTTSALNRYPESLRRWLLPRYPRAINELSRALAQDHQREPIDLLISTSSSAIKSIAPPTSVPHLCYCHSPARYLWSQTENYASPDLKGRLRSLGLRLAAPKLREWDRRSAANVTHFIANSTHTANEIQRCYQRESTVIHPPVRTDFFTPDTATHRENHLLLVSALEPYKRVDLAIDAAVRANTPLIIVGTGSHERALRSYTRSDLIRFVGQVTNEQLREHYQRARAFLFPQIEDFGITAVEAQACACPVIARRAGGALDSVIDHQTGVLFDDPSPQSIAEAIGQCPDPSVCAQACRTNALRCSNDEFDTKLAQSIEQLTR